MSASEQAFPLSWPVGFPRTSHPVESRFGHYSNRPSVARSLKVISQELDLLPGINAVVSSNVALRLDGLPRADQANPRDVGVALYFTFKGKRVALACDKWRTPGENLWAIGKYIEALRGQARWGVGSLEQAFAGYTALPAPGDAAAVNCWEVLGLPDGAASTVEAVNAAYREKANRCHPDRPGGSHDAMAQVNKAREEALACLGRRP